MSQFDKFDKACKRLNLSNADQGILLQVTPTMISRYRNRVSVMSAKRCNEYFPVALKVLKALRDQGYGTEEVDHNDRRDDITELMRKFAPELVQ